MRNSIFYLLLVFAAPAFACHVTKTLTKEQIAKADAIFEGRVLSVQTPKCSGICESAIVGRRVVVFQVEKVLSGLKLKDTIEVYWQNGTFGEVDSASAFRLRYGDLSKVGVIMPDTINKNIRCQKVSAVTGLGEPTTMERCQLDLPLPFLAKANATTDKPWVVSEICSESFIERVNK